MRIWILLRKKHKIMHDTVVEVDDHFDMENRLLDILTPVCRDWDIGRPIVMRHHLNEFEEFGRVIFRPDHFIDSFDYDTLEIEALIERKKPDPDLYA